MLVLFTHTCPHCSRKWQRNVQQIGTPVRCVQCGNVSTATDPHLESLALDDCMKQHAELAMPPDDPGRSVRTPR
ncbi:MAG: hypothetical protein ACR2NP_03970 [Pirellulaceae bacterium]